MVYFLVAGEAEKEYWGLLRSKDKGGRGGRWVHVLVLEYIYFGWIKTVKLKPCPVQLRFGLVLVCLKVVGCVCVQGRKTRRRREIREKEGM